MDKELWRDWVENSYDTKQVIYKQKIALMKLNC